MAKFQLYLMSLRESSSEFSPQYSIIPISEFNIQYNQTDGFDKLYSQQIRWDDYIAYRGNKNNTTQTNSQLSTATLIQDQSFVYTFNEKFQIHQNSQRTLTFTMYRNLVRADRIETNPFINYLFIGAQLLLVDKYNNHHLMTVTKISYVFNELNTQFNYECQDSFNYQLSRQNSGYEIQNDLDSDDFIGAQELDWWVLCKIHPECKISYQYLKLDDYQPFKESYSGDQYKDYHRTIPFSGSGTANSVLIALGENYGLQLQVYEHVDLRTQIWDAELSTYINNSDYGKCDKYYWFTPTKNLKPTGLSYSPYGDLQNFTLEHTGSIFASVLNIVNNTIGDEIITVIPSVPNFFRQWFETEEWRNSLFYSGLFSSACHEHVDYIKLEDVIIYTPDASTEWDDYKKDSFANNVVFYKDDYVYIPIKPRQWHTRYEFLGFSTSGGAHSKLSITAPSTTFAYNSKYNKWDIVYKLNDTTEEKTVLSNETEIPYSKFNDAEFHYCYLKLYVGTNINPTKVRGDLFISQNRIPTAEELEFATIADQLPWLENKLISFDYFYEHSIINASEHGQLMRILENDLRKANAKLLLYSQLYYQAIQNRTKLLANLSTKLDTIGATFQADIITPYLEDSRVTNTTNFVLAMSDLFSNSSQSILLLNYYEVLSDYVNKYLNAEQTFLKNMYLFRNYFDSKANLGTLYYYSFILPDQTHNNTQISFTSLSQYILLNQDNKHCPLYEKIDDHYILYDRNNIVTNSNISRFCYLDPTADNMIPCSPDYPFFNDKQQYFERSWIVKIISGWPQKDGKSMSSIVVKYNTDEENSVEKLFELELLQSDSALLSCYMSCIHTSELALNTSLTLSYDETQSIQVIVTSIHYKPVDYTALRNNFFYQELCKSSGGLLNYIHRRKNSSKDMLRQVDVDANSSWVESFSSLGINPKIFLSFPNSKNWTSSRIQALNAEDYNEADMVYKETFPITSMYWYGQKINEDNTLDDFDYHNVPFVNIENCQQFHRRVSLSCEEKQKWKNWQWINITLVPLLAYGVAYWAWSDGMKDFNNSGWTFHDIFNCDYAPEFGDGWTTSTRFMYVTNSDGYDKTHKKNIFSDDCFDSSNSEAWKGQIIKDGKLIPGETYQNQENEDTDVAQVVNWNYHEATNIPLTYYSFMKRLPQDKKQQYYYNTKYWRIIKGTDTVNNLEGIEVIVKYVNSVNALRTEPVSLQIKNGDVSFQRLDATVYYPLKHAMVAQSLSEMSWPDDTKEMTLEKLLIHHNKGIGPGTWSDDKTTFTCDIKDVSVNLIFVKTEDFNYEDITNYSWGDEVTYDNLWEYASSAYYDNCTHQEINLITSYPTITEGFYVAGNEDTDYIPATELNDSYLYYEHIDSKYEPRYTMNQLIDSCRIYVKQQNVYDHAVFGEIQSLNVTYFVYNKQTNTTKEENGLLQRNGNSWILTGASISTPIALSYTLSIYDFNNCTNGWFWYQYKDAVQLPLIMEKAMLIETNLTEYWTGAYFASKNCKFFLPEHWQPTINQKTNYFSKNILSTNSDRTYTSDVTSVTEAQYEIKAQYKSEGWEIEENGSIIDIQTIDNPHSQWEGDQKLTTIAIKGDSISKDINGIETQIKYIITKVRINDALYENINATTYEKVTPTTPANIVVYCNETTTTVDTLVENYVTSNLTLSSTYIPQVIKLSSQPRYKFNHISTSESLTTTRATQYNLYVGDNVAASSIKGDWIDNMFDYLNIDINEWVATKLSQTDNVIYQYHGGGMLWKDALDRLTKSTLQYDQFGGWYDMMIKTLCLCNYQNYSPIQYNQAKQEQESIWRQIYIKYPNLIYEQSYTNEDASTPQELLTMAQWAFKDHIQPESNYNISVIDSTSLKGYKGQELSIGDGIEINASELYDDAGSDVYKSLIQYLYITDISYDLRQDDNIQLTVNSIKYRDKVIGELVKLIR